MRFAAGYRVGVKRVEELIVFQLAHEFKIEAYRLTRASVEAHRDLKFWSQLFEAAGGVEACIAEGFRRWNASEFAQFLRYALASLDEGELRLKDGVDRGHFTADAMGPACHLAKRCRVAALRLHKTQVVFGRSRKKPR